MGADPLRRVGVGQVDGEVGRPAGQRVGELAQQLLAAGDQDQLHPRLAREPDRGRLADPGRGSGDQCDAHRRTVFDRRAGASCKASGAAACSASCKDRRSARARPAACLAAERSRREGERVTPLELFFDLVFVLAITQCTALMAHHPTWSGLVQGLLVLGVLWWAWVGYAWLTSVIDPEEGAVRLVIFVAMAAMLIVSLCVPEAFGNLGLTFALAYGVFRVAHIALFMLASPDDDALRHSVLGLAASTAVAVTLLAAASLFDGLAQGALWALALFLDMAGPYFFGSEGWKLVPGHFAERHGLIVIIALGESIVAIGVGAAGALDLGIGAVAVLGVAPGGGDVVDLLRRRRPGLGPAAGRSRGRPGAERAGPRLLLLHPPAAGRRDRPRRPRPENAIAHDDEHLARRPRLRPARRRRDLPARPGRLPLPPRPHDQPRSGSGWRSCC